MRRFAKCQRVSAVCISGSILWLMPLLFASGCGSSDPAKESDPASGGGGADSATGGNLAPTKENYVNLINRQAQLTREIGQIFQQSQSGGNLEALASQLNEKKKLFDSAFQAIQKMPSPNAELAAELQAGPIKTLDSALAVCEKAKQAHFNRSIQAGFITPESLFDAIEYGEMTRAMILKSIPAEQPKIVAKNAPKPDAPPAKGTRFDRPENPKQDVDKPGETPMPSTPAADPGNAEIRWQVAVDPPSVPFELEPGKTFEIPIPGAGRLPFPAATIDSQESLNRRAIASWGILYPETPSLIVRVGNNFTQKMVSEVWDLAAKKKLGTIRGLRMSEVTDVYALSPRGAYFAAQPHQESAVGLWDVKAGKILGTLKVEEWTGLDFLAFGAEDRLVMIDQNTIKIFQMPSGDLAHAIQVDSFGIDEAKASTLSPGGRYLVVCAKKNFKHFLEVYDILEGQIKGRIAIGDKAASGIAFSKDGTQFATFTEKFGNTLRVYNVARGGNQDVEVKMALSTSELANLDPSAYKGPRVTYFPDGKRLLVAGKVIIDAANGRTVGKIPAKTDYEIRIIGDNRLSVLNQNKLVPWDLTESPAGK